MDPKAQLVLNVILTLLPDKALAESAANKNNNNEEK